MDGGEHLRVAGSKPHRLVVVVELGVAGIDAGDEPCGCRSTGVVESVAREHGGGRAMVLRAPGDAVELTDTVVRPLDGRSLVGGDHLGGGRSSGVRGEGKKQGELTVDSQSRSVGSWTAWRR